MKTLFIIILNIVALFPLEGQEFDTIRNVKYAIDISRFTTGSGFLPGTGIEFTYISQEKKTLSFGFFYSPEEKKISGIILRHECSLRSPFHSTFSPYFFYHMIYRFTRTEAVNNDFSETTSGLYKSMEHHIGMGMKMKISNNIFAKAAMGYGVYFGSIKKPTIDPSTNETIGSNGFSAIGLLAVQYVF